MCEFNLNDPKHVYFIGIGGISMSGLAELLLSKGFTVSGSDMKCSELTTRLEEKGATIYYDQSVSHIGEDTQIVVYTAAVRAGNADLDYATANGIPTLSRAELLGLVMKTYECPIAISGTHGKTTTTSMVSEILLKAGTDPTLSIGGMLPSIGGNFRIGGGKHFVTEACEYTNSFLHFYPLLGIILNIDADHLDFFKDLNDIRNSFREFAKLIPEEGLLIINGDIPNLHKFILDLKCRIITVGHDESSDYYAKDVVLDENAHATYTVMKHGEEEGRRCSLGVPGMHNVYNSLAAIALSDYLGIDDNIVINALKEFGGSKRRFEYKGDRLTADKTGHFHIYDDYAHHPTEIKATIQTALKVPHNELWVIFQPHTYTRTKALMTDFAEALAPADHVILTDIYAARETDDLGISSATLVKHVRSHGTECHHISDFGAIEKFVSQNCTNDDMLITMGAGDVVKIGDALIKDT